MVNTLVGGTKTFPAPNTSPTMYRNTWPAADFYLARSNAYMTWDFQFQVETPRLTVTGEPVVRGQQATFELKGIPPGAVISNWRYASDRVGNIIRGTDLSALIWKGFIADAGTASVDVRIGGVTQTLPKSLAVSARNLALQPVGATPAQGRTLACAGQPTTTVPVPVTNTPHALGIYCLKQGYSRQVGYINDQGPNRDVRFLLQITVGSTNYRWLINPDLADVNCQFYLQQTGTYPGNPTESSTR